MLEDLHVFAATARSRSFSEAARQLGLPSSSVSRRIGALEHRLGVSLFVRTTRHIELTEAGRVYLASVQRALAALEQGENAVMGLGRDVRGTLVVDARVLLGATIIAPVLPELRRRHPLLKIDLRLSHSLSPDLADGVDIAVRYEIGPDSQLISRKFALSRRVVVASPDYVARHGAPKHPQELASHECVVYAPDGKPSVWRFRGPGYEGTIVPDGGLVCNDGFSMLAATVRGMGLWVAHDWMVAGEIKSGRLCRVLEDFEVSTLTTFETPLYLIYNAHLRDTFKVRAFVDCVLDRYQGTFIVSQ